MVSIVVTLYCLGNDTKTNVFIILHYRGSLFSPSQVQFLISWVYGCVNKCLTAVCSRLHPQGGRYNCNKTLIATTFLSLIIHPKDTHWVIIVNVKILSGSSMWLKDWTGEKNLKIQRRHSGKNAKAYDMSGHHLVKSRRRLSFIKSP